MHMPELQDGMAHKALHLSSQYPTGLQPSRYGGQQPCTQSHTAFSESLPSPPTQYQGSLHQGSSTSWAPPADGGAGANASFDWGDGQGRDIRAGALPGAIFERQAAWESSQALVQSPPMHANDPTCTASFIASQIGSRALLLVDGHKSHMSSSNICKSTSCSTACCIGKQSHPPSMHVKLSFFCQSLCQEFQQAEIVQEESSGRPHMADGPITFDSLQQILASVSKPHETTPRLIPPLAEPFHGQSSDFYNRFPGVQPMQAYPRPNPLTGRIPSHQQRQPLSHRSGAPLLGFQAQSADSLRPLQQYSAPTLGLLQHHNLPKNHSGKFHQQTSDWRNNLWQPRLAARPGLLSSNRPVIPEVTWQPGGEF